MNDYSNSLIFGKDDTQRIVSVETQGSNLILFKEQEDGSIEEEIRDAVYWFITNKRISSKQEELEGNQFYKYLAVFDDEAVKREVQAKLYQKRMDFYTIWDNKEANLLIHGMTYFKGMKPQEVSVLSFDIESDSLVKTKNSEIYIITNTFRKNGVITRKAFFLDEYDSLKSMIDAWCAWVRQMNPSLVIGHNIYSYDFVYLEHVARLSGTTLNLGRDGSPIRFNERSSQFRKDGSQSYEYYKAHIFGREIVDTMFVAISYDIGRAFPSYGLKPIIRHLGLEKEGRTFIDAGKMREIYHNRKTNPEMWEKAKQYAIEDSDDALKLFDLMIPAKFYFTQNVSKTFQEMCCSATGSQMNNIMTRAYLQDGHSIAKANEAVPYEGALSLGIPGEYKNCVRWDIASLYPSIMRQYKLFCKEKDPKMYFYEITNYFALERLKNKKLAKETNLQYYKDLEQTQKVGANSLYGFLGAQGLNYNYPEGAAFITAKGREILGKAIYWASGKTVEELYGNEESIPEEE